MQPPFIRPRSLTENPNHNFIQLRVLLFKQHRSFKKVFGGQGGHANATIRAMSLPVIVTVVCGWTPPGRTLRWLHGLRNVPERQTLSSSHTRRTFGRRRSNENLTCQMGRTLKELYSGLFLFHRIFQRAAEE